jgi:hypothetical protein
MHHVVLALYDQEHISGHAMTVDTDRASLKIWLLLL